MEPPVKSMPKFRPTPQICMIRAMAMMAPEMHRNRRVFPVKIFFFMLVPLP